MHLNFGIALMLAMQASALPTPIAPGQIKSSDIREGIQPIKPGTQRTIITAEQGKDVKDVPGNYYGQPMNIQTEDDTFGCREACAKDPQCGGFVVSFDTGLMLQDWRCHFRHHVIAADLVNQGRMTTFIKRRIPLGCEWNVKKSTSCANKSFRMVTDTYKACRMYCVQDIQHCRGITFSIDTKTCHLLKDIDGFDGCEAAGEDTVTQLLTRDGDKAKCQD